MNDNMITPFSKAAVDVLKVMMDLDSTQQTISVTHENDDLNVHIGLTGDVVGDVVYSFPKSTALEMVKIMCGMEIGDVDEFVTSALGEIANIISGNAATDLTERNISCDILPPQLVDIDFSKQTGDGIKISTAAGDMKLRMHISK